MTNLRVYIGTMLAMNRQHVVGLMVIAALILLYLLLRYGSVLPWSAR